MDGFLGLAPRETGMSLGWPSERTPTAQSWSKWLDFTRLELKILPINQAQFQGAELFPLWGTKERAPTPIPPAWAKSGGSHLHKAGGKWGPKFNNAKPIKTRHSSHPVGNKHPQVKFYEVLKGTLWVLREPSCKLKPAMEKQYNVNCGRQYLKILSLLPNQRNCSGERER